MPKFSDTSNAKLETCDPQLQRLFREVVKHFDCAILTGHRDEAAQMEAFHAHRSKTPWPHSKHNAYPSNAVDAAPYPIDWNDRERFTLFAGFVSGVASQLGIRIRWGGDWAGDTQVKNNVFDDLVHFELKA